MILGIGTDIVAVERFREWHAKPLSHLHKIFTDEEISQALSLSSPLLSSQFFASRFAVKEAFYKAFCSMLVTLDCPEPFPTFATIRRLCSVKKYSSGVPFIKVEWEEIQQIMSIALPLLQTHCSLSHEKEMAVACVIVTSTQ